MVGVEGSKVPVEIIKEDEAGREFIYRTPHFEFTSEGKLTQNLLRDVARNFEATYELLRVLPWNINPQPEEGDRFRALLVRSRVRYEDLGAPKNSGGVYFRSRKLFIVPFESLGIKQVGNSFAKSTDYTSDTLVHELTHQMMNAWLPVLPQWVVEGTAEYTNVLPLRFGRFRLSASKTGVKDYLATLRARGGIPAPYSLEELFWMDNATWNQILTKNLADGRRLYFTAYLLVYFFMNLDGKGDGELMIRYFQEVGRAKDEVVAFEKAWEIFRKQPGVEDLGDGKYRWPSNLEQPLMPKCLESEQDRRDFEINTLKILLNGRSTEQLMDDIRSAYRRLGLKL